MINHRILLKKIIDLIDPTIDQLVRTQIARRILAQNFNQVIATRKKNLNILQIKNTFYTLKLESGNFSANLKLVFQSYLEITYFNLNYLLILFIRKPKLKKPIGNDVNLFFGYNFTSKRKKQDQVSAYFMNFGKIHGFNSLFFIEQTNSFRKPRVVNSCLFTFSPLLSMLIMRYSHMFRIKVFFRLILEFSFFVVFLPFFGSKQLVIKDLFLQRWLIKILMNDQIIVNLFCSPNSLFTQNILFHKNLSSSSRNMIWYSASALKRPFFDEWYIDETLYLDLPIDNHYVWTKEHAMFLEQSKKCKAHVVGPQLFYLPSETLFEKSERYVIGVMDLTPSDLELFENTFYGIERGLWFLDQVHSALMQLNYKSKNIELQFKFKREQKNTHNNYYTEKVGKLCEDGFFTMIEPDVNLFDYISSLDCLITTQLTSVGLIAEHLSIDVIYLDPFSDVENTKSTKVTNSLDLIKALSLRFPVR